MGKQDKPECCYGKCYGTKEKNLTNLIFLVSEVKQGSLSLPLARLSPNSSFSSMHHFLSCNAEQFIWYATRRPVSDLLWRKSTVRTWFSGTKSSRCLLNGTSSPLLRTHLWFPCSALLRLADTSAWSWNMWKVNLMMTQKGTGSDKGSPLESFVFLRRGLRQSVEEHRCFACRCGQVVFCRNCPGFRVPPQLWHRAQRPQTGQVSTQSAWTEPPVATTRQQMTVIMLGLELSLII